MKLKIVGASNFVNRMFEACGTYQWAREFFKNAVEANATKIEFGIEWQAVEKLGIYRRTIIDNACGMDREELLKFFSTLGEGAKKIGGVHDNFGIGAKIASLPWNPDGVVIISYKNGKASMIWIVLDEDSGDYELAEFETPSGKECVVEPTIVEGIDWSQVKPDWITDSGTAVILLGSEAYPDTVLGNPQAGEKEIKGLSVYLNSRFWDLSGIDVKVVELRSEKKAQWPQGPNDSDNARRPNNRQIQGARYYLTDVKGQAGGPRGRGLLLLDEERVIAEWYLWLGERPHIDSYAKKGGYVAVKYKGELFQLTSNKVHFRWFGVVESKVQQNLTIILEPQLYTTRDSSRWGVHPDQSRNRLIFTGNGEKGVDLPIPDWGLEFAENIPDSILQAIHEARGDQSGSIDDEEYRRRLQDKFGDRWKVKVLAKARSTDSNSQPGTAEGQNIDVIDQPEPNGEPKNRRRRRRTIKVVNRPRAISGGPDLVAEKDAPVDVPQYRFASKDEFEKEWHLALWSPNDPDGPTVLINIDSPILREIEKYHQDQYPDVYAEEVTKTVQKAFGEIAACKIAHSQKLSKLVSQEQLNSDYRNESALTISLMGLLAEESLIAQRLGKLGRKKSAA
jgi:hypothetical protein